MTTEERITALTGAVQIARETFLRYAEIHDEKLRYMPTDATFISPSERKKVEEKRDQNLAQAKLLQAVLNATKEP